MYRLRWMATDIASLMGDDIYRGIDNRRLMGMVPARGCVAIR